MLRIDAIIPTRQMRAKLDKAGVELPGEKELYALSKEYNERLERARRWENKEGFSWFNLFTEIDEDGSGYVTYDELRHVTRVSIGLKASQLSDHALEALWCALDADESDRILPDEMGRFLRLAPTSTNKGLAALNAQAYRERQIKAREAAESRDMARVDATIPTREMRAMLEDSKVELPGKEELLALSKTFNQKLEEWRRLEQRAGFSWFNLFSEIDEDGSGYITFDELKRVARTKIGMKSSAVSGQELAALWCALDLDDSDKILPDEMVGFLKLGAISKEARDLIEKPKSNRPHHYGTLMDRIDKCDPTIEMRAQLEAEGVELPEEPELIRLSNIFIERLEKSHARASTNSRSFADHKGKPISLMHLFNEVDEDHSGSITFDELKRVARTKIGLKPAQMSDQELGALWCALDVDDSNSIKIDEMFQFLRGNVSALIKARAGHLRKPSPTERKRYYLLDEHKADQMRMIDSIASKRKSVAKRDTRIEQLQEQLRKLNAQLPPKRKPLQRSPRSIGSLASPPRTAGSSRPGSRGSLGYPPGLQRPVSSGSVVVRPPGPRPSTASAVVQEYLKEVMQDIARETRQSRMNLPRSSSTPALVPQLPPLQHRPSTSSSKYQRDRPISPNVQSYGAGRSLLWDRWL